MNIFSLLRRHEVVRSQRGCRGGFLLGKRAEDIALLEILEITEGPLDIIGCLAHSGRGCERESRCGIQPVWRRINAQIRDLFADRTLRDVWEEAKLSKHKEVSYVI
jgi:Rrf2 family protein